MFPNILKVEQKSELLLFHKAVSVHGPSCLSSVMAAREEDRYRISMKNNMEHITLVQDFKIGFDLGLIYKFRSTSDL